MRTLCLGLLAALSLAAFSGTARAESSATCAPCAKLTQLKASIRGVKPDPENQSTRAKQEAYLSDARPLILEAIGPEPRRLSSARWAEILPFVAFTALYDPDHSVARALLPKFGADAEFFYEEVSKAEKNKALTEMEAGEIRVSFLTAESWIADEANPPKL